jgi:hypothetical protein
MWSFLTFLPFLPFLLLLAFAAPACASNAVCGNAGRPQCAATVGATRYLRSVEPVGFAEPGCVLIPDDATAAQRTLVDTVAASHANGRCHLTVVGGLATEMTQAEKDAVNTAMAAVKAEQDAIAAEAGDPQCSKATMAQIDNFFQQQWDDTEPPTNTNDFKGDIDALTTNSAAAIRTTFTNVVQRMLGVVKKVAKCNRALGG